jgi:2-amino-4-hydroxy-6-hydroxymethyldihydropteridine diphosphokinase
MILLGLGSNMGEREQNLQKALGLLEEDGRVRIDKISSIYETVPFGVKDQADFLNMAALVQTCLAPEELLKKCLAAEQTMGRIRTRHWGPRIIDIDILTYNAVQMDGPELTLPHPGLVHRPFVLIPLLEIAPKLCLANGRTVEELTAAPGDVNWQEVRLYRRVGWDSFKKCFV